MEPDKDKAEVIIDYSQNYFRVSGNEVFVQKMINQIKPYFEQNLKEVKNEKADVDLSENVERSDLVAETKNRKFEKYFKSGIVKYDAEHDRYEIAASIPGKTNRKKMLNIGLILGLLRDGPVSRDEIKQQAELQNAYDGKNMSTYFAREKDDFIKRTNRGSSKWTVKLTVHGKSEAHELLKQIGENNE